MLNRDQLGQLAITLGGIPVWGCLPGSFAQRAGIRYGDVLLSVNGMRTANMADFVEARELRSDGILISLFREGRSMKIRVVFDAAAKPLNRERLQKLAQEMSQAKLIPLDSDGSSRGAEPN